MTDDDVGDDILAKALDLASDNPRFRARLIRRVFGICTQAEIAERCASRDIQFCDGESCEGENDEWIDDELRGLLLRNAIPDALIHLEREMPEIDGHFADRVARYFGGTLP